MSSLIVLWQQHPLIFLVAHQNCETRYSESAQKRRWDRTPAFCKERGHDQQARIGKYYSHIFLKSLFSSKNATEVFQTMVVAHWYCSVPQAETCMSRDASGPKVLKPVICNSLFQFIPALAVKKLRVLIPQHHATTRRLFRVVSPFPSGALLKMWLWPIEHISTITFKFPACFWETLTTCKPVSPETQCP